MATAATIQPAAIASPADLEGYTEWLLAEAYAEAVQVLGKQKAHAIITILDLELGE